MNAQYGFQLATAVKYGSAASEVAREAPTLNPNGTVHIAKEDGTNIRSLNVDILQHATMFTNSRAVNGADSFQTYSHQETQMRLRKIQLLVTDARLIFIYHNEPQGPQQAAVGQLRYPWIHEISFAPKQGIFSDPEVILFCPQDYPPPRNGMWTHAIHLIFTTHFHPGLLVCDIIRRIGQHHLQYGAPAECAQQLQDQTQVFSLPDPPKRGFTTFEMACYQDCLLGVPYLGDGHEDDEWDIPPNPGLQPSG